MQDTPISYPEYTPVHGLGCGKGIFWEQYIHILKNSSIIHEENTKKITAVSVVLYVIKFHGNLHA